jgi:aminopeptidase N
MHSPTVSRDFAGPGARAHYPPDLQLEIVHLDIALRVDPETETLEGQVTPTVRARSAASELALDAVNFEQVRCEGDGLVSRYDGRQLRLRWEQPFEPGEQRTCTIHYRVQTPAGGVLFSRPSESTPDAPRFVASDHETERARHWLPTIDHPSVRPTLAWHIRADSSLTILANGICTGEQTHDDGTRSVHYRLDHPCPSYLTCFCIGEFACFDDGEQDGIPFAYFGAQPMGPPELERTFGRSREMMRWLTRRIGVPFPYPRYYQFMVPGIGGAMENITLVSWDDRIGLNADIEPEHRQRVDVVNVHEMAHSYFGDLVVIRDFAHAWLKEAWAQYLECCWLEDNLGQDDMDYELWSAQKSYFEESAERYLRPIVTRHYGSSWQMFDRHLYPGGAWRLHMLRRMLGDDVFWPAVTEYVERFAGQTVRTEDFQRVLEARSGRSLGRFFDQWLYSPGYPKLQVHFEHDPEQGQGELEIEQTQVDEKQGIPCFEFDLEVAWEDAQGRHTRTLHLDGAHTVATLPMPSPPDVIRIDPSGHVLHELSFDPGETRLIHQLKERDVRGRIQAGLGLIGTGKRAHIERVARAFESEPHWGVRAEWAEALGKAQTGASLSEILRLLEHHDEPMSLPALLRAAGQYRDPGVTRVVLARLDAGLRPRATEAAHEALGAQREAAPFDRLVEASATRGWAGFAQAGALRALAATRKPEAVDVLIDRTKTADPRVRAVAAQSLGELAKEHEGRVRERAIEALVDLLRAEDARQRAGAAEGLVKARARDAIPKLEAYRATLPEQEAVLLDRRLDELRQSDGEIRDLRKTIEELQAKVRTLTDRVDRLE